jgi:hypothetical protein
MVAAMPSRRRRLKLRPSALQAIEAGADALAMPALQ